MEAPWDANRASPVGGMDAAIFAWATEERSRVLGQELAGGGGKLYEGLASAATELEHSARMKFGAFELVERGTVPKSVVDTRWELTLKMVEGKKNVRARLVAEGLSRRGTRIQTWRMV